MPMKPLFLQSLLLAAATAKNAIDEYVETPEPAFKWFDTGARVKTLGGTAHILNVTSLQWMTEAEAVGPTGALWTHQVAVVVPNGPVRHHHCGGQHIRCPPGAHPGVVLYGRCAGAPHWAY